MSKLNAAIFLAAALLIWFLMPSKKIEAPAAAPAPVARPRVVQKSEPVVQKRPPEVSVALQTIEPEPVDDVAPEPGRPKKKRKFSLPFVMSGGVAVVQGDVVLGKPQGDAPETGGEAIVPLPQKWSTRVIPYWIQPSVPNPDRVKAALALFDGTPIRFIEHTDQPDAMVFEDGNDICKSYIGRIGGLQPIWIPANKCGPTEIAHEIMHALGFIHEQNRADRDGFITVMIDNVEDQYRMNFEKLPQEFMMLSGLAQFDFESIMIYPVDLFAKGGQSTMESKVPDRPIRPGNALSSSDIERITKAYGQ